MFVSTIVLQPTGQVTSSEKGRLPEVGKNKGTEETPAVVEETLQLVTDEEAAVDNAETALEEAMQAQEQAHNDFTASITSQDGPTIMEASRAYDAATVAVQHAEAALERAERNLKVAERKAQFAEHERQAEARGKFALAYADAIRDAVAPLSDQVREFHIAGLVATITLDSVGNPIVNLAAPRFEEGFAPGRASYGGNSGGGGKGRNVYTLNGQTYTTREFLASQGKDTSNPVGMTHRANALAKKLGATVSK